MMTYGPKKTFFTFLQIFLAMLGICLGIITGHFEVIKKLKKKFYVFPKVVY